MEAGDETAVPGRAILFLSWGAFASAAATRACDPLLPQIAENYATTVGHASIVVTAFSISYGLMQVAFGPLGDRFGRYRLVLAGCFVSALTTMVCAAATSVESLAALRLLSGASAASIIPVSLAWIGDTVPYRVRQKWIGKFLTGQIAGLTLGQIAGGALGEHFGWRSVFLAVGAIFVVAGLGLAFEARANAATRATRRDGTTPSLGQALRAMVELVRRPFVRDVVGTVMAEGLLMFGTFAFVGARLHDHFGLDYDHAGLVLAVYGLGAITFALTAGRLVGALGEVWLVRAGSIILALSFVGLAVAPSAPWTIPALYACGLGLYMMHSTLQTAATQMAPDARGAAVALFASFFFIGQSVGVALVGIIVDHVGTPPAFFAAAVGLVLLGLWFSNRLARRSGMGES